MRERYCIDNINSTTREKGSRKLLSFCSNNYLGLANHPKIIQASHEALSKYGMGSRSSALLSGYSSLHQQLELELAEFLGTESAIVFSCGYMANIGLLSTLIGRHDHIFADQRNHASLVDGAQLSRAKIFRHGFSPEKPSFIISDGIFSMEGDFADLPTLVDIARQSQSTLIIDDAHAIGWAGATGKGSFEHFDIAIKANHILVGTLSKAFGCYGAYVAASKDVIEQLIQQARSYIYTTALPPHIIAGNLAALKIIREDQQPRQQLKRNIDYFTHRAKDNALNILPSSSPIQSIIIGSNDDTMRIAKSLENKGILVQGIRPPTVPQNTSRLRISLNAEHNQQQIDQLITELKHELA